MDVKDDVDVLNSSSGGFERLIYIGLIIHDIICI